MVKLLPKVSDPNKSESCFCRSIRRRWTRLDSTECPSCCTFCLRDCTKRGCWVCTFLRSCWQRAKS